MVAYLVAMMDVLTESLMVVRRAVKLDLWDLEWAVKTADHLDTWRERMLEMHWVHWSGRKLALWWVHWMEYMLENV